MKIFIIEGIDGSGKSDLTNSLQAGLSTEHNLFVREPGGTKMGDKVREVLNSSGEITIGFLAEMMLFWAGRFQLYEEVALPFLLNGQGESRTVFFDRSYPSSYAYQVVGREAGSIAADIFNVNKSALMRLIALAATKAGSDQIQIHHLWLEVEPALTAERLHHRIAGDLTQFDDFKLQQRAQAGYVQFFSEIVERSAVRRGNPSEHVHRIDASVSADEVCQQVVGLLKEIGVC